MNRIRKVEAMGQIKGRYGFTSREARTLYERWRIIGADGKSGWSCFDDFLLWCSRVGWSKSCHLRKLNDRKPHGPENSFWEDPDGRAIYPPGHPCRECQKEPICAAICEKRAAYWDERMEPLRRVMGVDGV